MQFALHDFPSSPHDRCLFDDRLLSLSNQLDTEINAPLRMRNR
jgi:hypothetical protein